MTDKPKDAPDFGAPLPLDCCMVRADEDHMGLLIMLRYDVVMQIAMQMTEARNRKAMEENKPEPKRRAKRQRQ